MDEKVKILVQKVKINKCWAKKSKFWTPPHKWFEDVDVLEEFDVDVKRRDVAWRVENVDVEKQSKLVLRRAAKLEERRY